MKKLIIVGTGAVALEITSYLEDTNWGQDLNIEIMGYLDDTEEYWKENSFGKPLLGNIDNYEIRENDYFAVCVAKPSLRDTIINKLKDKKVKFINLIHPSVIIARSAEIGMGNIIYPYSQVGPNAKIGNFNLITCNTIISHHSIIGDNNFIAGDGICGHVVIGNNNVLGIRSVIVPGVTIGDRNTIQAGMIVDKNVDDNATIFHRFKEKVIAIPKE